MAKRIIAYIITILMLTSSVTAEGWSDGGETPIKMPGDSSAEITLIVELEGGGILERSKETPFLRSGQATKKVSDISEKAEASISSVTETDIRGKLTHIMNGLVFKGSYGDIEVIKSLPQVKNVYVAEEYSIIEPVETMEAEVLGIKDVACTEQNEVIGAESVREDYTGEGLVIGIIDSELWYTHPVFDAAPLNPAISIERVGEILKNNDFAAEAKVAGLTVSDVYKSDKIPFAFDYGNSDIDPKTTETKNYHGTHVAGIAAADGEGLTGIAKNAQIAFAKVSPDGTNTMNVENILYALDDMVKLNVDVINMSLGIKAGFSDGRGLFDTVYKRIENAGICISVAAGNDGRTGDTFVTEAPLADSPDYGLISEPATCEYSTAVASLSTPMEGDGIYHFTLDDGTVIEYFDSSFRYTKNRFNIVLDDKTTEYVDCGKGTEAEFLEITDLSGKVALITRGGDSFANSFKRAEGKGALAVILINNTDEYFQLLVDGCSVPCGIVTASSGEVLKEAQNKKILVSRAPFVMSYFSSRGATPDLRLKPEVTAVGQWVYSAAYNDGYAYNAGTSMAAPQYAGAYAVVLDYINKEINPAMSKPAKNILANQLLASTAKAWAEDGEDETLLASPRAQGAGVINIEKAVKSPAVVMNTYNSKTKIELGEIKELTKSFDFKVKNISEQSVTYDLSAQVITDKSRNITLQNGKLTNVVDGVQKINEALVSFSCGSSVTVPSNSEVTVTATITLDPAELEELKKVFVNGFFVEGFIKLSNNSDPTLSIPFMGFWGDWGEVPIFGGEDYGFLNELCAVSTNEQQQYMEDLYNDETKTAYYSPVLGVLVLRMQNIRNIESLGIKIYNSGGQIVYNAAGNHFKKILESDEYKLLGGFNGKLNNVYLTDGDYTVEIIAKADCPTGPQSPQTLRFSIRLDTKEPQLVDAFLKNETINGTAARWLNIKTCDSLSDEIEWYRFIDSTGAGIAPLYKNTSTGYLIFNVGGYALESGKIGVRDAAGNAVYYDINSADGYIGFYDGQIFKGLNSWDALVVKDIILNRYDVSPPDSGYTGKLFVWDSNMKPLAVPAIIK